MKIFAESQVPDSLPYMHIGYLATTTTKPNPPSLLIGVIFILIGFVTVLKSVPDKTQKLKTFKLRKLSKLELLGLLIILFGGLCIFLSFEFFGKTIYDYPVRMTESRARYIFYDIEYYLYDAKEKGEEAIVPEDIKELQRMPDSEIHSIEDGWSNPFRILKEKVNGKDVYFVISAGEDEIFDTPDDIIFPTPEFLKAQTQTQKNN